MPQLPSGRHIAINANALDDLEQAADDPANVHRIMAIASESDLYPYIDVIFLLPEQEAGSLAADLEFRNDSLPRPPGFVPVKSGFRLSDWDSLTADWSEEDRDAFRQFIDTRARPVLSGWLECIRTKQRALHQAASPAIRILAGWWRAGVHPAQEEGWDASDVGSPEWDDCDMLAALGRLVAAQEDDSTADDWRVRARLMAYWHIVQQLIPEAANWPQTGGPVRACAEIARSGGWLERLGERDRFWLHEQGMIESAQAWESLGDQLRKLDPQACGIIELVTFSHEAIALQHNSRSLGKDA